MAKVDLRRLSDLSDADLWDKLGTNEVPWYNGADELHKRLLRQRDQLAEMTWERDRINRDAERHARRAEQAEAARDGLRVQVDQLLVRHGALRDKLDWATTELNRVWTALRGVR